MCITFARRMAGSCQRSTRACTILSLGKAKEIETCPIPLSMSFLFLYRMVEGELFPAIRKFGLRFYAYNPVSTLFTPTCVDIVLQCPISLCVASWWPAHWQV